MPASDRRILIVDDDAETRAFLARLLRREWDILVAGSMVEAIDRFNMDPPDVVLLDVELPDGSGVDLLSRFKAESETTAIVMMSGQSTLDRVVRSMQLGAETFLQKPFDLDTLAIALEQAHRMARRNTQLLAFRRGERPREAPLVGVSPPIAALNEALPGFAAASAPLLIEGESGTGKGVLARLVHGMSPRAQSPFVDLNCPGLSRELLESELFGHERGAFTGATHTKPGLFEIVGDGTLFLDEIGEMDILVQARLLKAIEEKRFRRVGGVRDLTASFRLVVATNRDLSAEVAAGRFRRDLYYRLNVVKVKMPALRERLDDMPLLVHEILSALARDLSRPVPKVSAAALRKLVSYPWPGNVRELRNVLERAMLSGVRDEVMSSHISLDRDHESLVTPTGFLPTDEWSIQPLDAVIARYVAQAVTAAGGNMRKAARALQISPSTLYARLRGTHPTSEVPDEP